GLVLHHENGRVEYLRVRERGPCGPWDLPRGRIDAAETPEHAAVRAVLEEAAIWARIVAPIGCIAFGEGQERIRVQFFAMEYLDAAPGQKVRRHGWLPKAADAGPRKPDWQPLEIQSDISFESRKIVALAAGCLRRAHARDQANSAS